MRRFAFCLLFGVVVFCGLTAGSAVGATTDADTADGNVTVYRAGDTADLENAADVRSGIENGTIEDTSRMLVGETLVVELESDRLAAELEAQNDSPTAAFFDVFDSRGAESDDGTFALRQADPSMHMVPSVVHPGPANTTVYRHGNVTYTLVDTGSVSPEYYDLTDWAYYVQLETPDWTITSDEPDLRFYRSEIDVSGLSAGDPLPAEEIQREIDVNVGPKTGIEARLELEGGETRTDAIEPAIWTDQRFSFDLSDVDHGTAYTLELRRAGETVRTIRGEVLKPHARLEIRDSNATIEDSDRNTKGIRLSVELTHGGVVRIGDPTDGSYYDREHVGPNETHDVTLSLATYDDVVEPDTKTEFHVLLERESESLETHYPDGVPAAVVHENGSVTQYAADFEEPTEAIVEDSLKAENTTANGSENAAVKDDEPTDEPSGTDGVPGFSATVAVAVLLAFVGRICRCR